MPDVLPKAGSPVDLAVEVARLNRIVAALMDRAERSTSVHASSFGLFQRAITLEGEVRRRTAELEAALRENEKITRALRESEAKFRGLVSQSLVGIVTVEDGKFTYSNAKFDEMFGYTADEVRRLGPLDVATEEDRPVVAEEIRKRLSRETGHVHYFVRGRKKDGTAIDIEIHGSALDVGGKVLLISLVMDVTDRLRAERELRALQERFRELSVRDPLTGLFNRRYLEETLARELAAAARNGQPVSLLMADLDHFKHVNDRYGHAAGDEVLRSCSDIFTRFTRAGDICCRFGGEEFLLVLPQMTKRSAADRAEMLRAAIADMVIRYEAEEIRITSSFGVATYPADGRAADALIEATDRALYAAKSAGRNRVVLIES